MTETALSGLPDLIESDATNLAGEDTGRAHLSASQVSTLLACPQKYAYSYEEGIEPIAIRPALSLGKAFQLAIEYGDPEVGAHAIFEERSPAIRTSRIRQRRTQPLSRQRRGSIWTATPSPRTRRRNTSTGSGSATRGPGATPTPLTSWATPTRLRRRTAS